MPIELTAGDIDRLFRLLEQELDRRGVAASIYVVGGAAIALRHDDARRTADVDARVVPEAEVLAAAEVVASAEGVPPGWLNQRAVAWIPKGAGRRTSPPAAGLDIAIATPETLLAMKLVASRNRDLADIRLLAEDLGLTDARSMADLVREQYGDELEHNHGGYSDMLNWCEQLVARFWRS